MSAVWDAGAETLTVEMATPIDPAQQPIVSALQIRVGGQRGASSGMTLLGPRTFRVGRSQSTQADPGPDAAIYTPPTPPFGNPLRDADGDPSDPWSQPITVV